MLDDFQELRTDILQGELDEGIDGNYVKLALKSASTPRARRNGSEGLSIIALKIRRRQRSVVTFLNA